jgi:hypothetical protein
MSVQGFATAIVNLAKGIPPKGEVSDLISGERLPAAPGLGVSISPVAGAAICRFGAPPIMVSSELFKVRWVSCNISGSAIVGPATRERLLDLMRGQSESQGQVTSFPNLEFPRA